MKHRLVGVIGHVDHGKTALTRALTGMETDRLEEEQRRGISIALGFAHLTVSDTQIDLVDMPGHERFVRTMIAGATGIDAVLLVVAANEGVKPQTIEHLDIAALLGLKDALIVVTKADLVLAAEAEARAAEAAALAARAGLSARPPLLASAVTGAGIAAVAAALAALPARPARDDGFPFLPVDRVFSIAGHGTVATGTLRRGPLARGDALVALPGGRPLRIRSLQVHGAEVASAAPGARVAINLRGVEPADVPRGTVLTREGIVPPSTWLTIALRTTADAPPLAGGARLRLLHGTREVGARLRLLDRDTLEPGAAALAQLHCAEPIYAAARDAVILRTESPARTIAGGPVLMPAASRQHRHAPALLARLEALGALEGAKLAACEVEQSGPAGTTLGQLALLAGTTPEQVRGWLEGQAVLVTPAGSAIARPAFQALLARLPGLIARRAPDGLSIEQLGGLLRGMRPDLLAAAVAQLVAAGQLRRVGGRIAAPAPDRERRQAREEEALAALIERTLRSAGLAPPDLKQVSGDPRALQAANRLVRHGVLVRTADRVQKREILFHAETIAAARRTLAPALADPPGLTVAEIGKLLGISRKYSVPLLEHLDAIHWTRRDGDRRRLAAAQG